MKTLAVSLACLLGATVVLSGCGRAGGISAAGPAGGAIRAVRIDNTVIVEVGLANVPESVKLLTLGLKLRDGKAVFAKTVRTQLIASPELAGATSVAFAFDGNGGGAAVRGKPDVWLHVTFELEATGPSADGSTFSLVLGDADTLQGCEMGITTSIFTRDGSPSLSGCIVENGSAGNFLPLTPGPQAWPPIVSFRFVEGPSPRHGARAVPIVPAPAATGLLPGPGEPLALAGGVPRVP